MMSLISIDPVYNSLVIVVGFVRLQYSDISSLFRSRIINSKSRRIGSRLEVDCMFVCSWFAEHRRRTAGASRGRNQFAANSILVRAASIMIIE